MRTRRDLAVFVASLPLPKERRDVVRMELEDHVFESIAELEASGVAPAEAERRSVESLGDPAELGAQLVEAQIAYSISTRRAILLGIRTGGFVAAVALLAGYFDASAGWPAPLADRLAADWMAPSVPYYLLTVLALLAACPRSLIRPFLAAQRASLVAKQSGNTAAVKRLEDPMSSFLAALLLSSGAPFFFWMACVGIGVSVDPFEGLLLRTIFSNLVVTMIAIGVAAIFVVQVSFAGSRGRGRLV